MHVCTEVSLHGLSGRTHACMHRGFPAWVKWEDPCMYTQRFPYMG